jgi:hypothetical protein
MNSITTIEGLLFRSYLCFYNLSLLHKCIKANDDDYNNDVFKKASLSETDFQHKLDRAKKNRDVFEVLQKKQYPHSSFL